MNNITQQLNNKLQYQPLDYAPLVERREQSKQSLKSMLMSAVLISACSAKERKMIKDFEHEKSVQQHLDYAPQVERREQKQSLKEKIIDAALISMLALIAGYCWWLIESI